MVRDIDDVSKRNRYKDEQLGNKMSRKDDYTRERKFKGNKADAKHRHPSNKTLDTDHITPLNVVKKRYPELTKEQQQKLANNAQHNYALTNSKLNRSKGDLENHEYLIRQFKKGEGENLETTTRMLAKEAESRVVMRAEATVMYTQNIFDDIYAKSTSEEFKNIDKSGREAAFDAVVFAATLSITDNIRSVIKGEESKEEAVMGILSDTASSAILGYATGAIQEVIGGKNGEATLLVNGTIQISKQMIAYINGNINEKQLVNGIAESSAQLAATYAGKCIGKIIGDAIAPEIGGKIGQCIGEMITTAVCSEVISTIQYSKEFDKQNAKMISLYRNAESEIKASQERLEYIIQKENNELINTVRTGFEEIMKGIETNSYMEVESGLATIGSKFGLTKEEMAKDNVKKDGLFAHSDEVLEIE